MAKATPADSEPAQPTDNQTDEPQPGRRLPISRRGALATVAGLSGLGLLGGSAQASHGGPHWQKDVDANDHTLFNLPELEMIDDPVIESTDGSPLEIRIAGERVARFEPISADATVNLVGGAPPNSVDAEVEGATIAGGGAASSPNRVTGDFGAILGGAGNTAGAFDSIGGGQNNTITADFGTIGGGNGNTASGDQATVGGGTTNTASDNDATVAGGQGNDATASFATVAGGRTNTASGLFSAIGGGGGNEATGNAATAGGGVGNEAIGTQATIGGGGGNEATGSVATVGGGSGNRATGSVATVSGGQQNEASGALATVVGGFSNTADGDYSFAAGRRADTNGHPGAFVVGDSTSTSILARNDNEFRSQMPMYAPSFNTTSARAKKTNVTPVSPAEVLEKVESLSVSRWEFTENGGVTHMGPMAEEFHEAFEVGGDDETIATVDADGVALAAIQGLAAKNDETDDRIEALEAERAARNARIDDQRDRIDRLESTVEHKDAELDALHANLDTHDERIDDLEAENDQLRERLCAIEDRIASWEVGQSPPAPADD